LDITPEKLTEKLTVGIFMALIPIVHRYAVDCVSVNVLNLNKRTYRLCSCGAKQTEEHLRLNCTLHFAFWVDLLQLAKSILLKEGLQKLLSSVLCDQVRLLQLLLFGHPSNELKPTTDTYNAVSKYLAKTLWISL